MTDVTNLAVVVLLLKMTTAAILCFTRGGARGKEMRGVVATPNEGHIYMCALRLLVKLIRFWPPLWVDLPMLLGQT